MEEEEEEEDGVDDGLDGPPPMPDMEEVVPMDAEEVQPHAPTRQQQFATSNANEPRVHRAAQQRVCEQQQQC